MRLPPNHGQCCYCGNWFRRKGLAGHMRNCPCRPNSDVSEVVLASGPPTNTWIGLCLSWTWRLCVCSPCVCCWLFLAFVGGYFIVTLSVGTLSNAILGEGEGFITKSGAHLLSMAKNAQKMSEWSQWRSSQQDPYIPAPGFTGYSPPPNQHSHYSHG